MSIKESKVTLSTSDGPMDLHCFVPESSSTTRLPAIIILQEAFGVNPHIKRVCQRVAAAGYAAFAPELFHRTGAGLEFGYDEFPKIKPIMGGLTNAQIAEDLRVTHSHVRKLPQVDFARIASWGFCLGGWAAVLAACELPLAASISFYGGGLVRGRPGIGFTPLLDRFDSIQCPLLLVYGAQDTGIPPEDIQAVQSKLTALGKTFELEIYPDAGHGFFCEDRAAYHRASAEASWTRATTWLAAKLG
jgi:carboxymethylenebutenolidase